MEKAKLYEDIKLLTNHVYDVTKTLPQGWQILNSITKTSGFRGNVYHYKTKKIDIIALIYAGIDLPENFANIPEEKIYEENFWIDFGKFLKNIYLQLSAAIYLYNYASDFYPQSHIVVGGNSLGGSLAQLVSAYTGVKAVTFNAFGTGSMLKNDGLTELERINVENFGDLSDFFFKMEISNQPGITHIFTNEQKEIVDFIFNSRNVKVYLDKQDAKSKEKPLKIMYKKIILKSEEIFQNLYKAIFNVCNIMKQKEIKNGQSKIV